MPVGIYKRTIEGKVNMSLAHKGQIPWNKGKYIQTNTGRTHFKKGEKGYWTGKKRPEVKLFKNFGFKKGHIPWNKNKKGIHLSPKTEFKKGMIAPMKGRENLKGKGEKCHFWQGGISFEPYSVDWTKTLKRSIRQRDNYVCQICSKEPATFVHHKDYNKLNCNPDNLITLCNSCHAKTNFNRNYWLQFFGIDIGF